MTYEVTNKHNIHITHIHTLTHKQTHAQTYTHTYIHMPGNTHSHTHTHIHRHTRPDPGQNLMGVQNFQGGVYDKPRQRSSCNSPPKAKIFENLTI